ncbi:DUF2721 domain-containing protein [Gallalistipes aquisgranensis]|uniref:DUF2721 domain-containing protein n=1 Tax=Gallalistipes aquisgranensis TaxID=2779358 RepID=UPI001CF8CB02|nr:DUF2721 domain-containing protein [Gallalistipes aquisgranensis]MBE5033114.1 DUF2721 domain-containing protein [Gallalistipes aquisgranensis]
MEELTLATPSILFSAISLIMLAYTNRFLSYAQVIRNISAEYRKTPSREVLHQIKNLKKRLYLTRSMQILGIFSLFLCVVCTFFIYVGWQMAAVYIFAAALISLIVSLGISIREILISVRALEIHLEGMENGKKE